MSVRGTPPQPVLHRPESLADMGKPRPLVADATDEQAAALAGMKAGDKLAEAAGIKPEVLAETKRQEWREHR